MPFPLVLPSGLILLQVLSLPGSFSYLDSYGTTLEEDLGLGGIRISGDVTLRTEPVS